MSTERLLLSHSSPKKRSTLPPEKEPCSQTGVACQGQWDRNSQQVPCRAAPKTLLSALWLQFLPMPLSCMNMNNYAHYSWAFIDPLFVNWVAYTSPCTSLQILLGSTYPLRDQQSIILTPGLGLTAMQRENMLTLEKPHQRNESNKIKISFPKT